jgi:hypothetical protein
VEEQDVPVQLPTVLAALGSVGLYQDHTTSHGDPAGGGTACDRFHRRYPRHGGDRVSPERQHYRSGVSPGEPGGCGQPPQVGTDPHSGNRVPGVHCQPKMELRLPGEKIKKIRAEAGKILQSQSVSALALSQLIGKMNAAT